MAQNKLYALWAKKPRNDDCETGLVKLSDHLQKTANVAAWLYDNWLPENLRHQIQRSTFTFIAFTHDLGKASPIFQTRPGFATPDFDSRVMGNLQHAGFTQLDISQRNRKETPHALVSFAILKRHGFDDSVCVIAGGHHGTPPSKEAVKLIRSYKKECGFTETSWISAQATLLEMALVTAGITKEDALAIKLSRPAQMILSGLVILADWIASSETDVNLPSKWQFQPTKNIYHERFGISQPRPVQEIITDAVSKSSDAGIFIIEAPMGDGKTEAALAAAEMLAAKAGSRGIYFALPSQATSNAMFTRVKHWMKCFTSQGGALSIRLSHGKAALNDEYDGIRVSNNNEDTVIVNEWLTGRKKGMLADFTIGTIDHVLMAGLQQKHLALRHLGLANKVLIIDECHAYNVYMESYLLKSLRWLGAYGVPVIILSATLPTQRRRSLVAAYLGENEIGYGEDWSTSLQYPLVTYTNDKNVESVAVAPSARSQDVAICELEKSELVKTLKQQLKNGGYAGIICNTVKEAQRIYKEVSEAFDDNTTVELLHSGFMLCDRVKKEDNLLAKLGKDATDRSGTYIIVGTQIFEQSLDIDFDVLFTELCPMDLLLQRIGRLHRHERNNRPTGLQNTTCYVMGTNIEDLDKGSTAVYEECLLMRTVTALPQNIVLPQDIPKLVACVYDDAMVILPPKECSDAYEKAMTKMQLKQEKRKTSASGYQISGGLTDSSILGLLNTLKRESESEAAVRDGMDSIEVLLIQKCGDKLQFLPWVNDGEKLPRHTPEEKQAKDIARCAVRLPSTLCYNIGATIDSIEELMSKTGIVDAWYESYWLKGELVLILDEEQCADIGKHRVRYNKYEGIIVE